MKLVDVNGQDIEKIENFETVVIDKREEKKDEGNSVDCMIGTEMLGVLVSCKISTYLDDPISYFRLNFGPMSFYESRVPSTDVTDALKEQVWKELLSTAFAVQERGRNKKMYNL